MNVLSRRSAGGSLALYTAFELQIVPEGDPTLLRLTALCFQNATDALLACGPPEALTPAGAAPRVARSPLYAESCGQYEEVQVPLGALGGDMRAVMHLSDTARQAAVVATFAGRAVNLSEGQLTSALTADVLSAAPG